MKVLGRIALCLLAILPLQLLAQGTTGGLTGATTTDGKSLPGVSVTVASASLQGTRTTVTGDGGAYSFPSLPPGEYTVTFDLSGMQTVQNRVLINVAQTSRADANMRVASMSEAVTVTAASPIVETPTVAANLKFDQVNELPMNRTIDSITLLSPGVTEAGPNNQITISGSHSFDSLFMVDGVIVNDNLRGQPNPLYIEDAIQETTILTGGVSAEFGRFTGGVVSTITKSGGNEFSGSLRDSLTNPNWSSKTDFANQVDPLDDINSQYEGTLGGRIIRDRLWFFGAGRYLKKDETRQTTFTNIPYPFSDKDRRYEAKLTAQITPKHSLIGTYTDEHDKAINTVVGRTSRVMDLRGLAPYDQPRSLLSINYNGVLAQNLLLEGQFSRMRDRFTQGAETRDLIQGTLLLDTSSGNRMWSSSFCGSPCPAKQRNNKEYLAKGSYFLSTNATGNHSLVGGYDDFHQLRNENNFQSGSDLRIHGVILCNVGGIAVVCDDIPPGTPLTSTNIYFGSDTSSGQIEYDPVPALSKTSDFAVRSLFFNDKWDLNTHWSFNVGVRYDKAYGRDQAGHKTVDDSAVSPRLAMNLDPKGNGKHRFSVTYGRYVSKVDQGPGDFTSTAGRYASYYWDYTGPLINAPGTPVSQLLPTDQVIRRIFDWFATQGGTSNVGLATEVSIPGTTTRFDRTLRAPHMDEWTLGYGLSVGSRGYVRADFIHRDWADFYSIRRTIATGKAVDPNGGTFDQGVIENASSGLSRRYEAIQVQANSRLSKALQVGGNYTFSRLRGNVEGESASGATGFTSPLSYPEYVGFAQNNPVGYLGADMRHRGNVWAQYDLTIPLGVLNFSLLEHYHSALSYSAVGTPDIRQGTTNGPAAGVVNPGYQTPPTNVSYYFSKRGAFRVDNISATDLGINWYLPQFGGVRPFIETDLLNLFNQQGIEDPDFVDQTVLVRRQATCLQSGSSARCVAFNPRTQTPVEGVNYRFGANFGKPTSKDAYQLPRTYRFSVGLKF